ncbi:hypothetical protein [Paracoccus mutanolyticus]|uniref:hypothetical protein n=1 Tax=Paracoccus mutanolyticus TaxID=1499308 RepID=UPI001CB9C3B6|nr:hypothetical protein [Paracoccus mutanolyticus]
MTPRRAATRPPMTPPTSRPSCNGAGSGRGDRAGLRAVTDVFDALSASSTDQGLALDRHWRNARTAASHNPAIYKQRILGDHAVNGTEPVYVWQIGAVAG